MKETKTNGYFLLFILIAGAKFFEGLKKYLLTAENLSVNGYPVPDPKIKGKALVETVSLSEFLLFYFFNINFTRHILEKR